MCLCNPFAVVASMVRGGARFLLYQFVAVSILAAALITARNPVPALILAMATLFLVAVWYTVRLFLAGASHAVTAWVAPKGVTPNGSDAEKT